MTDRNWADRRLTLHATELVKRKAPVVLAGDYNVIPTDIDVYKPKRWVDDALFCPESRAAYHQLVEQGWTDSVRKLHPKERTYTFWDCFRNAFDRHLASASITYCRTRLSLFD
jgi:exodeoxyribonuclease-3